MGSPSDRGKKRTARAAESQGHQDHTKHWTVGGLGLTIAATMVASGDGVIPPFVGGILWATSLLMVVYGMKALELKLVVRIGVAIVATVVAYQLWQAKSPHADIRVTGFELLSASAMPGKIGVNIDYENRGHWSASVQRRWRTRLVSTDVLMNDRTKRALEDTLFAELQIAPKYEPVEMSHESAQWFTIDDPVSADSRKAFDYGSVSYVLVGEFHYRDWWFLSRVTRYCKAFSGNTRAVFTCTRYNDVG